MATSVKKRIRRRPSWLSPMWRDIDSLRRQNALSRQQNEELRKENEAIKRETEQIEQEIKIIDQEIEQIDQEIEIIDLEIEQIDQEIEQIDRETEQIEQETEQIEQETAILRRQNKALAFLESRDFDKMVRELAGPADGDARHPLDRVDVGLLCEKLVEHGCDERDLPFLLNALDLEIPKERSQTSNGSPLRHELPVGTVNQQLPETTAGQLLIANTNKLSAESDVLITTLVVSGATIVAVTYSKINEDPELAQSLAQQVLRGPSGALHRIIELGSEQGLVVTANQAKDYASDLAEDTPVILSNE
ncbi:MAG: hypothetical protein ACK6BG_08960 [Cyanobacteriota bacterium]